MTSGLNGALLRNVHRLFVAGTVSSLSEDQLLKRFVTDRDELAFEALVARHGPMVIGVCRRVLGDAHDAEDAFQATFAILARRADSVRAGSPVGHWLHGVARRVSLRLRAESDRRRTRERLDHQVVESTTSNQRERNDLRWVLDEEIGRLPDKYRAPILLCYLEGYSHDEAAERLAWPVGTVRGRLSRARELLRSRLVRRGIAPSAVILTGVASEGAVSPALTDLTIQFALRLGKESTGAAGMVSARVIALTDGVLKAMLVTKLKTALIAVTGLVTTGVAVYAYQDARSSIPGPGDADGLRPVAGRSFKAETRQKASKPAGVTASAGTSSGSAIPAAEARPPAAAAAPATDAPPLTGAPSASPARTAASAAPDSPSAGIAPASAAPSPILSPGPRAVSAAPPTATPLPPVAGTAPPVQSAPLPPHGTPSPAAEPGNGATSGESVSGPFDTDAPRSPLPIPSRSAPPSVTDTEAPAEPPSHRRTPEASAPAPAAREQPPATLPPPRPEPTPDAPTPKTNRKSPLKLDRTEVQEAIDVKALLERTRTEAQEAIKELAEEEKLLSTRLVQIRSDLVRVRALLNSLVQPRGDSPRAGGKPELELEPSAPGIPVSEVSPFSPEPSEPRIPSLNPETANDLGAPVLKASQVTNEPPVVGAIDPVGGRISGLEEKLDGLLKAVEGLKGEINAVKELSGTNPAPRRGKPMPQERDAR